MAFSTQKDFFHVPFMNQTMEYECRRACVKLKSYESTIDDRSWAMDEAEPSRFLYDLVKCNSPITGDENEVEEEASSSRARGGPGRSGADKSKDTSSRGKPGESRPGTATTSGSSPNYGKADGSDRTGTPEAKESGKYPPSKEQTGSTGKDGPSSSGADKGGEPIPGRKWSDTKKDPPREADKTGDGSGGGGSVRGSVRGSGSGSDSSSATPSGSGKPDTKPDKTSSGGGKDPGIGSSKNNQDLFGQLKGADSVIECANRNLSILNELLNEKEDLQKKLEVSNERLQTANEENEKIKNIVGQKFDKSHSKDFHNKIQKLASSGKISKSEENELLNTFYKVEDMYLSYEVIQAENSFLKRLAEKLSQRATLNSIKSEPETSSDIQYLQNEVNTLRKELILLRKTEDDRLRSNQDQSKAKAMTDQDAAQLKAIMEERNALREKCKSFKDLEKKIRELQRKAQDADKISNGLCKDLEDQSGYIAQMEKEMQRMQKYYEDEMQKLKYNEELLKCQLQDLKEELCRANCKAQKADCLQMEIGCLRNELLKRELALGDYDCQYKQLMHKAKAFKNCGYRLLKQLPEACQDSNISD